MPRGVWKDSSASKRSEAAKKAAASRARRVAAGVPVRRSRGGGGELGEAASARLREIAARVGAARGKGSEFVAETPGAVAERIDAVLNALEAKRR